MAGKGVPTAIELSPDECAYIAVCSMPPSFAEISYAAKNKLTHRLDVSKLSLNNTMLLNAVRQGYGTQQPLRRYFEGMDDGSHNMQLFKKFNGIMPKFRKSVETAFRETRKEIDNCSVKLGYYEAGKFYVWYPSGIREDDVKTDYLPGLADGEFLTIHGAHAIRKLNEGETIKKLKALPKIWNEVLV